LNSEQEGEGRGGEEEGRGGEGREGRERRREGRERRREGQGKVQRKRVTEEGRTNDVISGREESFAGHKCTYQQGL